MAIRRDKVIAISRAQFLSLTGLDVEAYKSLRRRDQVPFQLHDDENIKYDVRSAFLFLVSQELARCGFERAEAARFAVQHAHELIAAANRLDGPVFAAIVREFDVNWTVDHYYGTWEEINSAV